MTRVRIGKTPDCRRIEVSRELPVRADRAWSPLVDTERWPEWGPSVRSIDCDDRRIRAGSTGHVGTPLGIRVIFEVPLLAGAYVPVCRRALERIAELV